MQTLRAAALAALFVSLISASAALADTPQLTFSAGASTLSSGATAQLTFSTTGTGTDLYVSCPQGVTVQIAGGSFPCGIRRQPSSNTSGAVALTVFNVSGATQTVNLTLYPRDTNGVDTDGAAQSANITVYTVSQPILNFAVSTSTATPFTPLTFSWTGYQIPYANMQFDCASGVQLYSTGSTTLPCGQPAFTTDLPQSGSVSVWATNSTLFPVDVTARMVPAAAAGAYDATHARPLTFTVLGMPLPNANPVSATSFSANVASVVPTAPFLLSWTTANAAAANVQFGCSDQLSFFAVSSTSTAQLPCGAPAFKTDLSASGSTTIMVKSASPYNQTLSLLLLPKDSKGTYYATNAKQLSLPVMPTGTPTTTAIVVPPPAPAASTTPSQPAASVGAVTHVLFNVPLGRGSSGSQVAALQTFLSKNPSLYPEAAITAYYGPATQRAVGRFQEKYGLAQPGDDGYGTVGPKTRAKLNSLQTP